MLDFDWLKIDFLKMLKEYGFFILSGITALYEKKYKLLIFVLSILLLILLHDNFLSKNMQNKRFVNFVKNEFNKNTNIPFYDIMDNNMQHYSGENELIKIAQFFTRLTEIDLEIYKKYRNDVTIWQVVVNDMPSYVYQLNDDVNNNNNIKNKTDSMVAKSISEDGFNLLLQRKYNFDHNPIMRHISIYWKEGLNQNTFENNVKKSGGVNIKLNSTIDKIINNKSGKINGIKLDIQQKEQLIHDSLRGQFTIIKNKNGVILLFIESNGEQKRQSATKKDKMLRFYKFYNKNQIQKNSKLYTLLNITGILDTL